MFERTGILLAFILLLASPAIGAVLTYDMTDIDLHDHPFPPRDFSFDLDAEILTIHEVHVTMNGNQLGQRYWCESMEPPDFGFEVYCPFSMRVILDPEGAGQKVCDLGQLDFDFDDSGSFDTSTQDGWAFLLDGTGVMRLEIYGCNSWNYGPDCYGTGWDFDIAWLQLQVVADLVVDRDDDAWGAIKGLYR